MLNNPAKIGPYRCGGGEELLVIAGPCVIENQSLTLSIAERLAKVARDLPVQIVFKASFDKANRTSLDSYRGGGLDEGLRVLQLASEATGLPVTTDIHESQQAAAAAEVCALLQIPAFLSRQTDLLMAAASTGRSIHVKKGQFMAPGDMRHVIKKLEAGGCSDVLLGERGTFFGYNRLVNDMRSIPMMQSFGVPVIFAHQSSDHTLRFSRWQVAAWLLERNTQPKSVPLAGSGSSSVKSVSTSAPSR
jgi:2-dehydro-3-deoxyphosphooctonate aldolase (KDO 8-P synthase)